MTELLSLACREGDLAQARILLANGSNPDLPDQEGWYPIHYAAENGFNELVLLLLESGADATVKNASGYTPLDILLICEHYTASVAAALIDAGCKTGSPLHEAILRNDRDRCQDLMQQQQQVTSVDELGNTPLHLAVATGWLEYIRPLCAHGAPIDAQDTHLTTPLMEAAANGNLPAVETLLELGAAIELQDYNGRTAFIFGVGNAHPEVAQLLIANQADLNVTDHFGNTALHYAYENEEFELVDLLLKHDVRQDIVNTEGQTPVMMTPDYKE